MHRVSCDGCTQKKKNSGPSSMPVVSQAELFATFKCFASFGGFGGYGGCKFLSLLFMFFNFGARHFHPQTVPQFPQVGATMVFLSLEGNCHNDNANMLERVHVGEGPMAPITPSAVPCQIVSLLGKVIWHGEGVA